MYIITTGMNPSESDILCHHGIKGQKWGVRRFQNKDGTRTSEGKQRERYGRNVKRNMGTTDAVNEIVRSLSREEKHKLGQYDKGDWIDKAYEVEALANKGKTFIKYVDNKPAAFLEIWTNGDPQGQVAIATKKEYRGKGYSTELVNQAKKWLDQYGYKQMDELQWWAREDNAASIHLAEKNGFKYNKSEPDPYGNTYNQYVMSTGNDKRLANSIYAKASKKEPKITSDVSDALKGTSAKFYGLENRLKTKESIERKIRTDAKEKNISMTEASKIKDAIRYTAVSKDNDYVKNYNSIKKSLENKGYTEVRCKNYFDLYNKGKVKHKSVQSVFQNKDGDIFELQFQTPASQNAKDKKVLIYEEARNPNTSPERKKQLEKQMELLAEEVSNPVYIDKIKSHG